MGAVQDHVTISRHEVLTYLRAEDHPEEYEIIDDIIESAKRDADEFLNNDFRTVREQLGHWSSVDPPQALQLSYPPAYQIRIYAGDTVAGTIDEAEDGIVDISPFATVFMPGDTITARYTTDMPLIPSRVRMWVIQNAARDYEHRTNGLEQTSDALGMSTWKQRDYSDIAKWRLNPGW